MLKALLNTGEERKHSGNNITFVNLIAYEETITRMIRVWAELKVQSGQTQFTSEVKFINEEAT